jgi:hypothetical protein
LLRDPCKGKLVRTQALPVLRFAPLPAGYAIMAPLVEAGIAKALAQ